MVAERCRRAGRRRWRFARYRGVAADGVDLSAVDEAFGREHVGLEVDLHLAGEVGGDVELALALRPRASSRSRPTPTPRPTTARSRPLPLTAPSGSRSPIACCWAARSVVSMWKAIVARIFPPVTMMRLMPISTSVDSICSRDSGPASGGPPAPASPRMRRSSPGDDVVGQIKSLSPVRAAALRRRLRARSAGLAGSPSGCGRGSAGASQSRAWLSVMLSAMNWSTVLATSSSSRRVGLHLLDRAVHDRVEAAADQVGDEVGNETRAVSPR